MTIHILINANSTLLVTYYFINKTANLIDNGIILAMKQLLLNDFRMSVSLLTMHKHKKYNYNISTFAI